MIAYFDSMSHKWLHTLILTSQGTILQRRYARDIWNCNFNIEEFFILVWLKSNWIMSLPFTPVFQGNCEQFYKTLYSVYYNWCKIVKSFYFKERNGKEGIIWRRKTFSFKRRRRTEKKKQENILEKERLVPASFKGSHRWLLLEWDGRMWNVDGSCENYETKLFRGWMVEYGWKVHNRETKLF